MTQPSRTILPLTLDHIGRGSDPFAVLARHRGDRVRLGAIANGMRAVFRQLDAGVCECSQCEMRFERGTEPAFISVATVAAEGDAPPLAIVLPWCSRCAPDDAAASRAAKAYLREAIPGGLIEPSAAGHA